MKRILMALVLTTLLASCTQQSMVRNWGGSDHVKIMKGQKLVNLTWKEDDLWALTRPMRNGEEPETYSFKESSSYGLMEGEIILEEQK